MELVENQHIILKYTGKYGVPKWLNTFSGYFKGYSKSGRIKVSVPVADNKIYYVTEEQIDIEEEGG